MRPRPIHLVGIGGAGMSGLARLAVQAGYRVSGTDRDPSEVLDALRAQGIDARAGHAAAAVPVDAATLVVSTAIAADNPELGEARARGLEILHRADLLAELMDARRGLAVAGAHGKSTTSGMLLRVLDGASACVGATVAGGDGTGALWGPGEWFVAEADESDRSLLRLRPQAAILLNVDHDHHSTFRTIADVEEVFRAFVAGLPADGVLVIGPDERARRIAAVAPCPVRQVRSDAGGFLTVATGPAGAILTFADGRVVDLALAVPGEHNQLNAACAIALADWCGVAPREAAERLAGFHGVGRRFEAKGTVAGVTVVDDYAHHPAEIRATLAAARDRHHGRIVVIFQPHLYSRTRALRGELGASLGAADLVFVTDIYAAREDPDPGIGGQDVVAAVPPPATARFTPTLAEAAAAALDVVRPGDLVLTVGAGDVTRLGQELIGALQRRQGDGGDPNGARTS